MAGKPIAAAPVPAVTPAFRNALRELLMEGTPFLVVVEDAGGESASEHQRFCKRHSTSGATRLPRIQTRGILRLAHYWCIMRCSGAAGPLPARKRGHCR